MSAVSPQRSGFQTGSYQTRSVCPVYAFHAAHIGQRGARRRHRLEAWEEVLVLVPGFPQHIGTDHIDAAAAVNSTAAPRTKPSSAEFTALALLPKRMGCSLTMPLVSVMEPPSFR